MHYFNLLEQLFEDTTDQRAISFRTLQGSLLGFYTDQLEVYKDKSRALVARYHGFAPPASANSAHGQAQITHAAAKMEQCVKRIEMVGHHLHRVLPRIVSSYEDDVATQLSQWYSELSAGTQHHATMENQLRSIFDAVYARRRQYESDPRIDWFATNNDPFSECSAQPYQINSWRHENLRFNPSERSAMAIIDLLFRHPSFHVVDEGNRLKRPDELTNDKNPFFELMFYWYNNTKYQEVVWLGARDGGSVSRCISDPVFPGRFAWIPNTEPGEFKRPWLAQLTAAFAIVSLHAVTAINELGVPTKPHRAYIAPDSPVPPSIEPHFPLPDLPPLLQLTAPPPLDSMLTLSPIHSPLIDNNQAMPSPIGDETNPASDESDALDRAILDAVSGIKPVGPPPMTPLGP
jgi:hypothetical protein